MDFKPGARLRSAVCDAEFVVVRPASNVRDLKCGGQPLVPVGDAAPAGVTIDETLADGIQAGKRYWDESSGLEMLASKGGRGTLTIDDRKMGLKEAKPLPSSD